MSKAKFFIYWNVHKKCFSVRYRGKVILHTTKLDCTNCTFQVSAKGRERVLREKKKLVHAFIVAESIIQVEYCNRLETIMCGKRIKYNPYEHTSFVMPDDNNTPVYKASYAALGTLETFTRRPYILAKVS